MSTEHLTHPIDETSRRALADAGLRLALVDTSDAAAFDGWLQADARGFLTARMSREALAEERGYLTTRRTTGVYDDSLPSGSPVGTVSSWPAPLTVPGPAEIPAWLISSVTVAPTHRRKGVATALLGGELRTAHALGYSLAVLTVSESVIYGRWGFGPATFATAWSVDTKRVRWTGPETAGRLSFTEPEDYRETGRAVIARVMASRAGEVGLEPRLADRLIGPLAGTPDKDEYRLVRYDSPAGEPEGFVSYTVKEQGDFTKHLVEVSYLAAATDEALTALWRYLIELDLVAEVRVSVRGVDEPLHALVSDIRGARVTGVEDHLWVRILDVPAALAARRYETDGSLVLEVEDALGFAAGRFRIDVEGGAATVIPTQDGADVTLPVTALGSVYLGHDLARSLGLAGRIRGDVAGLDRLFRTAVPPRLSTWF
ncbi:GNAT family N-acetyltransferase [Gryllotalpicola koreensis]|uniref:GNAT family N-acetyltransferase n=1 Tax=Gryllotalpicola koreensis TaxID=993086 RepID=A0ABP8A6X9_9MICO